MTTFRPQSGFESYWTQRVANNFPPWHVIRTDPTSTGQSFLHSWGHHLEEIAGDLNYSRKNLYPSTADTLVGWEGYRARLPSAVHPNRSPKGGNKLRNAGFLVSGPAYRESPLWWHLENAVFYPEDTKEGHGSVLMEIPSGETGTLYQDIELPLPAGENYSGSIYLKSPRTTVDTTGDYTLSLIFTNSDGTTDTGSTDLQIGTNGEWTRHTASLPSTSQVDRLTFRVEAVNNESLTAHLRLSAPQFEEGTTPDRWTVRPRDFDEYPFRVIAHAPDATGEVAPDTGDPVNVTSTANIELEHVDDHLDMFAYGVPTRVSYEVGDPGTAIQMTSGPIYYEFDKTFWETNFSTEGEKVVLRNRSIPSETIAQYEVLDNYVDNEAVTEDTYAHFPDEVSGFSRILEALTIYRRRIWVMSKETAGGVTKRVLKVLRYQGVGSRLETIRDILVGMDTGTVSSVGFVEGRHDLMAFETTDGQTHTLNLYYDYFFYDNQRNQVITRHPYSGYTIEMKER